MTKKVFYKIIIGIILYFALSTTYKLYKNSTITETCLTETFDSNLSDLSNLKINSTYDFNQMFNCQKWDEILITDAHYYYRGFGYLSNGVLVPSYDPFQYLEGTYIIYFLNNNIIVNKPIPLYSDNFILSLNLKNFNYIKIKRNNAKFIYKKLEHSNYDLNTLEIIK